MENKFLTKRKALKGSIRKWGKIVNGSGSDNGRYNCPLCLKYLYTSSMCHFCPVAMYSDDLGCDSTPYEAWVRLISGKKVRNVQNPEERKAAKAKLLYLKQVYAFAFPKKKKRKRVWQRLEWQKASGRFSPSGQGRSLILHEEVPEEVFRPVEGTLAGPGPEVILRWASRFGSDYLTNGRFYG